MQNRHHHHQHSLSLSLSLSPPPPPQSCIYQIFDSREVVVSQNRMLLEEFGLCLRSIFSFLESRIGETNEMGQRQKLIGFCGLLVLHHQLVGDTDKNFLRAIWDLYKKVCV